MSEQTKIKVPVACQGVEAFSVDIDHSLTLLSALPLTSCEPSGAHSTQETSILLITDFFSSCHRYRVERLTSLSKKEHLTDN
jgi:hypothetical protein